MTTKLQTDLKRELTIGSKQFVVTVSPEVLKLVGKGRRKGLEIRWEDLVSGDAALATALNASLDSSLNLEPSKQNDKPARAKKQSSKKRAGTPRH